MRKRRRFLAARLREYAAVLVGACLLAIFVRTWVVQAFVVPSTSMSPTLLPGDHLLVNKFLLRAESTTRLLPARHIRRGDVLVFRDPRRPSLLLVKRCLALPGDEVELVDKVLVLNGRPRRESYVHLSDERIYPASRFLEETLRTRDNFGPFRLAPGEVFCLGDARDISLDSRHWGGVPIDTVIGRAALVYRSTRSTPSSSEDNDARAQREAMRRAPRWVR